MKKHIFAICDPEAEYARNFMDHLNRKSNLPFEIQAFTGTGSLMEYARDHRIEILLIAEEAVCGALHDLDIGKIIVLTEGIRSSECNSYSGVYKYQASSQVIREVMACYGTEKEEILQQTPAFKKNARILGIYSPVNRCQKTSFALTMGQLISKERPVLYLNMEEYAGFEELFGKTFSSSLSDLLYHVRQGGGNITARLNSVIQSTGDLDFIPPVRSPLDIRETLWKDWQSLIQEIVLHSPYEVLILDIGNGIDEIFQLFELCTEIYMPVLSDRISCCKIHQFEKLLQVREYSQIQEKLVKLKLPCNESVTDNEICVEQLLWSSLGDFVREMLRRERL